MLCAERRSNFILRRDRNGHRKSTLYAPAVRRGKIDFIPSLRRRFQNIAVLKIGIRHAVHAHLGHRGQKRCAEIISCRNPEFRRREGKRIAGNLAHNRRARKYRRLSLVQLEVVQIEPQSGLAPKRRNFLEHNGIGHFVAAVNESRLGNEHILSDVRYGIGVSVFVLKEYRIRGEFGHALHTNRKRACQSACALCTGEIQFEEILFCHGRTNLQRRISVLVRGQRRFVDLRPDSGPEHRRPGSRSVKPDFRRADLPRRKLRFAHREELCRDTAVRKQQISLRGVPFFRGVRRDGIDLVIVPRSDGKTLRLVDRNAVFADLVGKRTPRRVLRRQIISDTVCRQRDFRACGDKVVRLIRQHGRVEIGVTDLDPDCLFGSVAVKVRRPQSDVVEFVLARCGNLGRARILRRNVLRPVAENFGHLDVCDVRTEIIFRRHAERLCDKGHGAPACEVNLLLFRGNFGRNAEGQPNIVNSDLEIGDRRIVKYDPLIPRVSPLVVGQPIDCGVVRGNLPADRELLSDLSRCGQRLIRGNIPITEVERRALLLQRALDAHVVGVGNFILLGMFISEVLVGKSKDVEGPGKEHEGLIVMRQFIVPFGKVRISVLISVRAENRV